MMRSRMMDAESASIAEPAIAGGSSRSSAYASGRIVLLREDAGGETRGGGTNDDGDGDDTNGGGENE